MPSHTVCAVAVILPLTQLPLRGQCRTNQGRICTMMHRLPVSFLRANPVGTPKAVRTVDVGAGSVKRIRRFVKLINAG